MNSAEHVRGSYACLRRMRIHTPLNQLNTGLQNLQTNESQQQDLAECIIALRALLMRQTRVVDALIHEIISAERLRPSDESQTTLPKSARSILPLMIQGAGSSCHTILCLSSQPDLPIRDCFPIARSIIETIINVCFILARGEEAAKRMERHALQKTCRDLDRSSAIKGTAIHLRHNGSVDPGDIPGLADALAEFSTSKGGERRSWTEDNLEYRLGEIATKFGSRIATPLHAAQFSIYRHSSEILHGTYFGCIYFFGATQPGFERSSDHARYAISNHAMLILFNLVMSVDALVQTVNAVAPMNTLASASAAIADAVKEIPLFKKELNS